jgi:tetratricopeptide (TPR) repeat protein
LLSSGYALLFFGYVENYALLIALTVVFGLLGMLAVKGVIGRWWTVIPVVLAGLFHPFAAAMVPALAYVLVFDTVVGRRLAVVPRAVKLVLMALTAVAAGVVFMHYYDSNYFFRLAFVPLFEQPYTVEGYTLFSANHLLDYLNLVFLLAPALVLLVGWLAQNSWRRLAEAPDRRFLLWFAAASLAIPFVIDPKLGMARDWDVFAFAGVPLTLLVYACILDGRESERRGTPWALLAVTLSAMILAPRIAVQTNTESGIAMFDNLADLDPLRNRKAHTVLISYLQDEGRTEEASARIQQKVRDNPERMLAYNGRRLLEEGMIEEAKELFVQAIEANPAYYVPWCYLCRCFAINGQFDSALVCIKVADGLNPRNPTVYTTYGILEGLKGNTEQAEAWWLKTREMYPRDYESLERLMLLYRHEGYRGKYLKALDELVRHPEAPVGVRLLKAEELIFEQRFPEAGEMLRAALASGLDTAVVVELQEQYPELEVLPNAP